TRTGARVDGGREATAPTGPGARAARVLHGHLPGRPVPASWLSRRLRGPADRDVQHGCAPERGDRSDSAETRAPGQAGAAAGQVSRDTDATLSRENRDVLCPAPRRTGRARVGRRCVARGGAGPKGALHAY